MASSAGIESMVTPLRRVIVKRPEEAFRSQERIAAQWQGLDYLRQPSLSRAAADHGDFVALLQKAGAEVLYLPADDRTGLDSLYVHDPVLMAPRGAVILQTGKPDRRGEGPALADALRRWDVPILGTIDGDATAEAGDMLWLDSETLLVGRGFRTNAPGVHALTDLLAPDGVRVLPFHLPYWNGVREVLHLQSFISMIDRALAVVYRRLLPVPMWELLEERGIHLIDVPDSEYDSMACNILALAPRLALMVAGNPMTRSRLEAEGVTVWEFDGSEICHPGSGGPTCLTRPLLRS